MKPRDTSYTKAIPATQSGHPAKGARLVENYPGREDSSAPPAGRWPGIARLATKIVLAVALWVLIGFAARALWLYFRH